LLRRRHKAAACSGRQVCLAADRLQLRAASAATRRNLSTPYCSGWKERQGGAAGSPEKDARSGWLCWLIRNINAMRVEWKTDSVRRKTEDAIERRDEMNDRAKCWGILPKVSRSFALCIKILPRPMNEQMMVAYLFYRVLDTIEDSHAALRDKKALFSGVLGLFGKEKPAAKDVARVSSLLLSKLDYTYEKEFLENLAPLVSLHHSQLPDARVSIRKWGAVMANGMYRFQKRRIETLDDQNKYSFYVAGVIGYLFNDLLLINGIITKELKRKLRRYARQFGLALQKVNILRDIARDIAENRHYWPRALIAKYNLSYSSLCMRKNREAAMKILREQIDDARDYLYAAMKYVLLLPREALKVRMFCIIPLFMAIESYAKCIDNVDVFESEKVVKITREQVCGIVAKSGLWGANNERLVGWFVQTMVAAGPDFVREEYVRGLAVPARA